jgi:histidinol dehydrogenase
VNIPRYSTTDCNFDAQLQSLRASLADGDEGVREKVGAIVAAVRERGDKALIEFTNEFDRRDLVGASQLEVTPDAIASAKAAIETPLSTALEDAARRIRDFHERQKEQSWSYTEDDGTVLGQKITPLDRVGVYVPGGKAAYPSSVLMNIVPARVAGVKEVIMVVPAPDEQLEDVVLAAAAIAGVDRVFTIGGAQAVAALAYGTETIPAVDKIVGPGNIYVATAKAQVFGQVGIDMIAGPSEILIVCDGTTDPEWIAMDLFSQAEHDEQAQAILLSPDQNFLDAVEIAIENLLPTLERADIVEKSLRERGALIQVRDLDEAIALSNDIAPEHLELSVENPDALLDKVRHAGAIFLGCYTAEALGDYCAGPNHVLPTGRSARYSSPLGVYDFQKRSSVIKTSARGASTLGATASILARSEGLTAHARSAEFRINDES